MPSDRKAAEAQPAAGAAEHLGFRVQGLGAWVLGCKDLGFMVWGYWVYGLTSKHQDNEDDKDVGHRDVASTRQL